MAKPTTLPEWATDTDYPAGAEPEAETPTKIEPSAPQKESGWRPGEPLPAQAQNWFWHLVWQWLSWLHEFFTIDGSDNLTIPAGLTLGEDGHVTVSGTGEYKHGNRTLTLNASDAAFEASANWAIDTESPAPIVLRSTGTAGGGDGSAHLSVPLHVGDRIKSISYSAKEATAETITVNVYKTTMTGAVTTIGTASAVALTSSYVEYALDVTDTTLAAGDTIMISFDASDSGVRVAGVMVTYDHP